MLPFSQMDLVSFYYDPGWPFEVYPADDWSDGPQLPAPTEDPDWSQVVVVHNNRASTRLCAVLSANPEATEGWCWVEGSMTPMRNICEELDNALEHAATDWRYDDDE